MNYPTPSSPIQTRPTVYTSIPQSQYKPAQTTAYKPAQTTAYKPAYTPAYTPATSTYQRPSIVSGAPTSTISGHPGQIVSGPTYSYSYPQGTPATVVQQPPLQSYQQPPPQGYYRVVQPQYIPTSPCVYDRPSSAQASPDPIDPLPEDAPINKSLADLWDIKKIKKGNMEEFIAKVEVNPKLVAALKRNAKFKEEIKHKYEEQPKDELLQTKYIAPYKQDVLINGATCKSGTTNRSQEDIIRDEVLSYLSTHTQDTKALFPVRTPDEKKHEINVGLRKYATAISKTYFQIPNVNAIVTIKFDRDVHQKYLDKIKQQETLAATAYRLGKSDEDKNIDYITKLIKQVLKADKDNTDKDT